MLRITSDVCASGVTDKTAVPETCTGVDWISLVACALAVTGETILAGTSSALDGMTFMHNNVGQTRIFAPLNLSFILGNLLS